MATLHPHHGSRKLRWSVACLATLLLLTVAPAQPASAATTLNEGNGFFVADTTLNTSIPCAVYTNYEATLDFDASSDSFGSLTTGTFNITLQSGSEPTSWGEFADGTRGATDCSTGLTAITGFTGTATNASQTLDCDLGHPTDETKGTYYRNGTRTDYEGLDITYTFTAVSGTCLGVSTPITIKTTIPLTDETAWGSECSAAMAPETCNLGPAGF